MTRQNKARLVGVENFLCGAFVRHKRGSTGSCIFYVYRVHAHVMNLSGICAPELGWKWLDKTPKCPATGRPRPTCKSRLCVFALSTQIYRLKPDFFIDFNLKRICVYTG